jgi:snurportin-1
MEEFRDMYKNTSQLKEHQVRRRMELLEEQKMHRMDQFSFRRDLTEIVSAKVKLKDKHTTAPKGGMRTNLMLSEWMMEKPEDIEDFYLVPCPKGKFELNLFLNIRHHLKFDFRPALYVINI